MRQTGFWANAGLIVASLLLLLAWGMLPLFTTNQPTMIEKLYQPPTTASRTTPDTLMLYGGSLLGNLDVIDPSETSNPMLFSLAWMLAALAGLGGIISGGVGVWRPAWMPQAAFAGVVCGVVALVCLGFLRFQYANMTSTSLFESTTLGWWILVILCGAMIGQGVWARPRPALTVGVPQPPSFSYSPRSGTYVPAAIDVPQAISGATQPRREAIRATSPAEEGWKPYTYTYHSNAPTASKPIPRVPAPAPTPNLPPAPRLRFVHLGTNQQYALDLSQIVSIGRSKQNQIVLPDQQVSRHHAVLRWQGEWVMIANQSQSAPLLINQQPIYSEQPLRLGDTVTLGQTHLRLISE